MSKVVVYSKAHCPYCDHAKQLLQKKGVTYTEIRIDQDAAEAKRMIELTQRRTVPQIIINGEAIGGFDDMWALEQSGQLDDRLNDKQ